MPMMGTPRTADDEDEARVQMYLAEGYERDVAAWLVDVDRGRAESQVAIC